MDNEHDLDPDRRRRMLQRSALKDAMRIPANRTWKHHLNVVWANYMDAFDDFDELRRLVSRRIEQDAARAAT